MSARHIGLTVAAAIATTSVGLLWRAIVLLWSSTAICASWIILLGVGVLSSSVSVDEDGQQGAVVT